MLETRTLSSPVSLFLQDIRADHLELNRLLAAAIVSQPFENLLLENPELALEKGYQGEIFLLTDEERSLILSIHAKKLTDLALELARTFNHSAFLYSESSTAF
jgi:hypothetical protein